MVQRSSIAPGEDDVFDKVVSTGVSKHVRFVEWTGPDDLNAKVVNVLVEELRSEGAGRYRGL